MAIICRQHKLLFIMVPGTGCSVVGRALQEHLGGEFLPREPHRVNGRVVVPRKHNRLSELLEHGLLTPRERGEYLIFATVRNPFDRWVTYYQRYAGDWLNYYEGVAARQVERDREAHDLSDREVQRRKRHHKYRFEQLRKRQRIMRWAGFNLWMKTTLLRWAWQAERGRRGQISERAFPMLDGVDIAICQEKLNEGLNDVLARAGIDITIDLPRKNETEGKKPYTEYYSWSTRQLATWLLGDDMKQFGYRFGEARGPRVISLSDRYSSSDV